MKRLQLVTLLWLCLLISCKSDTAPPTDRVASQFNDSAIQVGFLHSLSVPRRNASILAEQHVNQAGGVLGRPFNVIYNAIGTVEQTVEKALPMMDEYGIQALAVTTSSRTLAVAEHAIPREVVVISESATSPLLTDYADNGFLFRMAPSDVYQSVIAAKEAANFGLRDVAFIFNHDDPYGTSLADEFERNFIAFGGEQVDFYPIPETTNVGFDTYLQAIFADPPDLIVIALVSSSTAAQLYNEAAAHPYNGFYMLADSATNSTFFNNVTNREAIQNTFGLTPASGLENYVEFDFFRQAYLDFQGEEPQNYSSNAYDTVIILALAIEHAGYHHNTDNPSGAMIRDSLSQVMNPNGDTVGPSNLAEGLAILRSGGDINYQGAYSINDFDGNGDISGIVVYDLLELTPEGFVKFIQFQVDTTGNAN